MDVTSIPFVETCGIVTTEAGLLKLPFGRRIRNHLDGVHASAQFALAETASGDALQRLFPELNGKVVPLLRESQVKFRRPAASDVFATAVIEEAHVAKFREQFRKKQRATIAVQVEVRDSEGAVTCVGSFEWFIQGFEGTSA